jgi:signal transduction histidine kinase/ActR/RegA family two-component response regulator
MLRIMRFKEMRHGPEAARGVARAAAAGVGRHELIQEAVHFLLANTKADRVGVWMESGDVERRWGGLAGFRGVVADRDGERTPTEWERFSPEAVLPVELLNGEKSVEQDLDGAQDVILGALLEIRRAVWVPVAMGGCLRGLLLAGLRKKHGALPVRLLESVSAELAVAVELDEERRRARERQAEIALTKQFLGELANSGPTDAVMTRLVEGCTDPRAEGAGLGAAFAVLRGRDEERGGCLHAPPVNDPVKNMDAKSDSHADRSPLRNERCASSWQSGDCAWLQALESEPVAGKWERAREGPGTVAVRAGAGATWRRGDASRLVRIDLEAGGEVVGVLAVGFREESTSRLAAECLQSRAQLATIALVLRARSREIAENEARHRVALEASGAATILIDHDGAIVGLSRGAREALGARQASREGRDQFGLAADEIGQTRSRKFVELFHTWEHPHVQSWLRSVQADSAGESGNHGDAPQVELRGGGRGRLRCIQSGSGLTAVSLEALDVQDATSRRVNAEAQLYTAIEWLEEGVVLFDAQQDIQAMNSRFVQIAGLSPQEAKRITTLDGLIVRLAEQAAEPAPFARRWRELAGGQASGARDEIELLRPIQRVLERSTRPVLDADGRHIGRVEIYRDLTTQRLFQSKVLHTEKLAALGQMVTGVAHELSNPLTSILGYAQRLFLRSQAEGQPEEARQILQEAERASIIVRRLLMNGRESRSERCKVSLNQVVSRTMDLQKRRPASEKVNVELDLDAALPFVLGDAGQLQQVLMNLISNARHALEQCGEGGTIRISTKCVDSGGRARLEVSDNGPGIPPAIISRIFDPFFTTKPAGIGTGLGLTIVMGVMREHGGQVKVVTPAKGGAAFTLEFPAAPAEQTHPLAAYETRAREPNREVAAAHSSPLPEVAPPGSSTATRVLVVEDEPTVARLISDVLEDEGFQVEASLDGYEALERAARASYDLVVCDMKMAGLDGQHFYETLACMGSPQSKRFLFVTGDALSSHTREFLERHHLPHVAKPFRVEELLEKVRRVLADVGPSEQATRTTAAST